MIDISEAFDGDLDLGEPDILSGIEPDIQSDNDDIFGFPNSEPDIQKNTNIVDEFLKINGITDGKIKFKDENNKEQEQSFYNLSKEEQLQILSSFSEPEVKLDKSEQEFIDYLKANNLTLDSYFSQYKDKVVKELGTQHEQNYEIDAYDDQELFLLDLKSKYDLTDEELTSELEKELGNETLFKKKVDSLRIEYKKLEDQYKETQQLEFTRQREEEYNKFSDTIVDVAVKNPEFYGIELEDNEKNEVLSFLLDLDDNGASNFYKELSKPEKLYEAAWFLKYGKDALDALRSAYESEIVKIKKDNKGSVIIKDNKPKEKSIHDLFI